MVAIPPGGETLAARFYVDVLGLELRDKPESLAGRGGLWLSTGTLDLHLGVDPNFVPAHKAHIALESDDLSAMRATVVAGGFEVGPVEFELPGYRRCYVFDPFGNRVELMQADERLSLRKSL